MNDFLRGLLYDLIHRCQMLRSLLVHREHHPDVSTYVNSTLDYIARIEAEITKLAADPTLGAPPLLANNFREYRLHAQFIKLLEWFPVPAILHYGPSDHYFFALATKVTAQVNYPFPTPIVSAFSKDYYWAQPDFNLLSVPVLEEYSLLGLPDLFHELGHIVIHQCRDDLWGQFEVELKAHFATEKQRARDGQKPPEYEDVIEQLQVQWVDAWTAEFASDMVATYLVGPAYGWANLRLCSSSLSDDVFRPGTDDIGGTHPSDDARLRGIVKVLNRLGLEANAGQIEQRWSEYVTLTGYSTPPDYALCYPIVLIESLAKFVLHGCAALGLKAFTEQAPLLGNIPILLNDAWEQFLAKPDEYPQWEESRLAEVRQSIGI